MPTMLKILEVLIPILIGLGFRLTRLFGDEEGDVLRRFVVRFTVPVLVFFSMYSSERSEISAIPTMMAAFVLITVVLFFVGWASSRVVRGAAQKAAVHACVTFGNYGWMGFGVCQVLLGDEGLRRAVFFIILWWPVFYGLGLPIGLIHTRSRAGGVPVGKAVRVAAPIIGMLVLGLAFNLAGWKVPDLLERTVRPFGQMTVPLILLSVGVMLDFRSVHKALGPALLVSAATLVGGALIGWGVGSLLAGDPLSRSVIIVEAAMPVATLTLVFAENYEFDVEMAGTCIVVSTVLSLITLPVVAALLAL